MSVLDRFRLDGKRAFITGGSRGFGRVIALAAGGSRRRRRARRPRRRQRSSATAAEMRERGRQAWTFAGRRRRDPAACEALCERVLDEAGPIDILVNNVGGRNLDVPIEDTELATWQRFVDLNLTHCFLCTKIDRRRDAARAARGASSTSPRSAA